MAAQQQNQTLSASPLPADEKPQVSEGMAATSEVQQVATPEATKQSAPKSVFVNSEPLREDQIQNAVKFLSHPRVRGSPVIHRRSFLERKGLTKEEIDEAFRRVPDPPPSSQTTINTQDGQQVVSSVQPQAQTQTLQPMVAAPIVATPSPGILSRLHWYHGVIAVGLLAASGAGTAVLVKNSIIPRLKSWVRRIVVEEDSAAPKGSDAKPSAAEEAAAAAKAAAAAAADVARASQELMRTRTEEKKYFEEFMHLLDTQVQEMKSLSSSVRKLEGQTSNRQRSYLTDQDDYGGPITSTRRPYTNGSADYDNRSVRSASPPAPVDSSVPPHPKSYMEIMAMIQRGEKPPNIRDINDMPPNPNQQPSNPRIPPRAKPWDSTQVQDESYNGDRSTPWWQRNNPRITETENETGSFGSYQRETSTKEQPVVHQRTWVPPQPPPVAMPEAAEAIRRPKAHVKVDQEAGDDQSGHSSSGVTDELQKISKVSESGGEEGSRMQITEIQEEHEQQQFGLEEN